MSNDSVITLLSRQTIMSEYSVSKLGVAVFVDALLATISGLLSITITQLDMSEDSCVFSVIREFWEPVPQTSSSEPPPTSVIPLPGALWATTL